MNERIKEGALRVWWVPQVPGKAFRVPVNTIEEAILMLDTLARYDAFQFEQNVKLDYSNAGGLEIYENGEWVDWINENDEDIDDLMGRK